ncbi:MAG TPA: CvpA family protein [Pontiella sp.]|nr:CvpA family protein [Pontiella sp.]
MIPDWFSFVDMAFLGVALLFAWGGFQKGFAGHVAHILTGLIMGIFLFFAYPAIYSYLSGVFRNLEEAYLMWLLLVGLAVMTFGVFILSGKMLASLLKTQISDRSDRAYGFMLGFIRGALVALFAMIFIVMLGPPRFYDSFRARSYVGRQVCYTLVPRTQPHLNRATLEEKVKEWKRKLLEQEEAGVLE